MGQTNRINRRSLMTSTGMALAANRAMVPAQAADKRPNVVYVLMEDLVGQLAFRRRHPSAERPLLGLIGSRAKGFGS